MSAQTAIAHAHTQATRTPAMGVEQTNCAQCEDYGVTTPAVCTARTRHGGRTEALCGGCASEVLVYMDVQPLSVAPASPVVEDVPAPAVPSVVSRVRGGFQSVREGVRGNDLASLWAEFAVRAGGRPSFLSC